MLAFIDESGYPRPTDSTKNPILLAVCIHESDIKPITNQIYKLKESIYGKQDEIKSTKLIREATITKNRTNNKQYVDSLVNLLENFNITIFAIIMDKPDKEIVTPDNHLPKQYYLLMKKIEFFCTHHHYGKALLIYDEVHEEADRKIAAALTGFLFKSQLGKTFRHILEMPLFVSSSVTVSIQLADIFAGILRHYYENHLDTSEPSTEFHQWLFELFQKLQSHTENNKQPGTCFIEYGFQKIGKNFSYPISKNENPS
ncbi:MAG: DUF3800 domain-containing protein [Lachnospiraceae bacterium]|nr:DUF3800 domain-containing protein [Lachnospiraceae bacterium]